MKQIDITCIIDDDPIFVYGTRKIMEMADFSNAFMVYKNGKEALENLKPILKQEKNIPDVILLDINMPIMDGWQFLDEFIKVKTKKPITIFVVSSSIDPQDIEKAKKYSIVKDYILKPISPDMLTVISKKIVESKNLGNST
ncbi:response regulator [uncultured Winogradskyella sp.]|uniref:response regulator n=1 Tax=uncultured Winogradskyella sp. TaxID=395353 RepID=UPI002620F483|nr:response regulator [uncultured Winogradskyella sp.]